MQQASASQQAAAFAAAGEARTIEPGTDSRPMAMILIFIAMSPETDGCTDG
jgi:hypothetical protein